MFQETVLGFVVGKSLLTLALTLHLSGEKKKKYKQKSINSMFLIQEGQSEAVTRYLKKQKGKAG